MIPQSIKQNILAKYGKKFATKSEARPILQGIHYGADGSAFVTNGNYALRIKNVHNFEKPVTLHASTGMLIDGEYPQYRKIFPESFNQEIHLGRVALKDVLLRVRCALDVAIRYSKKFPIVELIADNGVATLHVVREHLTLKTFFGNTVKLQHSERTLNAEYLHTALSVLVDASDGVYVRFKADPTAPLHLTDGGDIDVLIMPCRTAKHESPES